MLILLVLSPSVYDLKSKTEFMVCVILRTKKLTLPRATLFRNFSFRETPTSRTFHTSSKMNRKKKLITFSSVKLTTSELLCLKLKLLYRYYCRYSNKVQGNAV